MPKNSIGYCIVSFLFLAFLCIPFLCMYRWRPKSDIGYLYDGPLSYFVRYNISVNLELKFHLRKSYLIISQFLESKVSRDCSSVLPIIFQVRNNFQPVPVITLFITF